MPPELEVTDTRVFVRENIHEVTAADEGGERTEYEFSVTEYGKNEYIQTMSRAQEAVCEAVDFLLMGGE